MTAEIAQTVVWSAHCACGWESLHADARDAETAAHHHDEEHA